LRICKLSAGWATCSAVAARLIEPVDTTATKHCIARMDMDMKDLKKKSGPSFFCYGPHI